jgi:phosphotransferase family enzyme
MYASITPAGLDHDRLAAFVTRRAGEGIGDLRLEVHPLRGGLEAPAVAHVRARFLSTDGRRQTVTFVAKWVDGQATREAAIYEALLAPAGIVHAPGLLGVEWIGSATCYLYLEAVTPWRRWPWGEPVYAALVLEQLAALHTSVPLAALPAVASDWDYELELVSSAQATLHACEQRARHEDLAGARRGLPALRRMVDALPTIRRQLLAAAPLGRAVIHGDAHPGNAMIRFAGRRPQAVLLDWGRTRPGSPLEDLSSWLQVLGYWAPEVRRRHETLLRGYLSARGLSDQLQRELRDAYWLAGASNILAGTLHYYLAVISGEGAPMPQARLQAVHVVHDYLRIIRRADACWRA